METKIYILVGFIGLLSIGSFFGTIFIFSFNYYQPLEIISVGDRKTLRIGILSDSQLNFEDEVNIAHLNNSLLTMKKHSIDLLIFAGDIGDYSDTSLFNLFNNSFNKIFEDTTQPILDIIMGNHDYLGWFPIPSVMQKRFYKIFKQKPLGHKVINGYHFINWGSISNNDHIDYSNTLWVKREIEAAIQNTTQADPVFVITHYAPEGTMYGSDQWGSKQIPKVLMNYPQVISLSGHSHYSLLDERSIWQGNFTAIQTQSTAYIELERGKENGSVPVDEFGNRSYSQLNYMGLIMTLNETMIEIQRVFLEHNILYNKTWTIDLPINQSNFKYTDERYNKSRAPKFKGDETIEVIKTTDINKKTIYLLHFTQATHDDFVHSYRIIIRNNKEKEKEKEYLYFSDFFLMEQDRKEHISLKLPDGLSIKTDYQITIYAIESFGKESNSISGMITLQ